jgi:1-acyl-sn-glycerol-3-phosphate acyltransferase
VPITYLRLIVAFLKAFWILFIQSRFLDPQAKRIAIQKWSADTLTLLGISVELVGPFDLTTTTHGRMLVSNHVSWLDPLVLQTLQHSIFVAKQEVSRWPVIGPIAKGCEVVFVNRGSPRSARQMVQGISLAIAQGHCVAGFPEGTSSDGLEVGPFHSNLFEAAISHACEVVALTLRYSDPVTHALRAEPAFIGEIGFLESLHRVICAPPMVVKVIASEPLASSGHNRRTLAQLAHSKVHAQLKMLDGLNKVGID